MTRNPKQGLRTDHASGGLEGHVGQPHSGDALVVVDNLPEIAPVTVTEIDALEMFLADIIDRLLNEDVKELERDAD